MKEAGERYEVRKLNIHNEEVKQAEKKKAAHDQLEGLKDMLAKDNDKLEERVLKDVVAKLKEASSIVGMKRKAMEVEDASNTD
jgi:hypothetical protein